MRLATPTLLLSALATGRSALTPLHATGLGISRRFRSSRPFFRLRVHEKQQQHQQQQLSPLQWTSQVKTSTPDEPLHLRGGGSPSAPRWRFLSRLRGGRSSDLAVFVAALAETALESGIVVAFVGATSYLADRFAAPRFKEVSRLAVWIGTVFLSGAASAGPRRWLESSQLFNIDTPISEDWYAKLRKPWWNPPNWVFPIMWVPLKILQVFACYEMWNNLPERTCLAVPVVGFAVYKSLGDVWNKVFFEKHRLKMGTAIISIYYASLLAGIKLFFDVSPRAGYLFAPTAGWVTIATLLQWNTWLLNRDLPCT